jgi:hypothetical protein
LKEREDAGQHEGDDREALILFVEAKAHCRTAATRVGNNRLAGTHGRCPDKAQLVRHAQASSFVKLFEGGRKEV